MLHLTVDELWKKVEEDRLREQRLREPYLMAFRALPQEIALREFEDAHEATLGDTPFVCFAEGIARSAREMVRFDRYLARQGFYPEVPKDSPLGVEPTA
jgi:DTW domain-containing protein YfiP